MNYTRDKSTLLIVYFLFYYTVFVFFFVDHRLLGQYQPIFFNYNRDLTELALIASGIPKWMIGHPVSFMIADMLVLIWPIVLLDRSIRKGRFASTTGILFSIFFGGYLLLADIFWQVHHEPFMLYLLLSVAFWTHRESRFYTVIAACRYYFLYVFVSAALWKISRGALFNGQEMSRILLIHHSDLLSGAGASFSSQVYFYLIAHPSLSWWLYLAGVLVELSFVIGFFTRKWDRALFALAVVFVIADWLVMRIPYWTVLMGGVTLWIRGPLPWPRYRRQRPPALVIYETTHHENLPALLDLGEAHFPRVVVYLRALSHENLSGKGSPAERWPNTLFIIQGTETPNRTFIRQLFAFIKKEKISHLHLSTLDNNLLFVAFKLAQHSGLQVSLTVHEVNEYFAGSFASFRDITESLAKIYLHGRIQHHTFFLPAMAAAFQQRLPGAVTVFIPSRFYQSPAPAPSGNRPFRVVVPGSVDANRREYETVIAFFKDWLTAAITHPRPVELVILGDSDTPYGADIVAQLQRLESPFFRLIHYRGYIPQLVYEQRIETADLLWSPLRVNKKSSRNSPETYGLTTASGLTADLLLNNAPALAPLGFQLPEPFQTALLSYETHEDWKRLFTQLVTDTAYSDHLRQEIHIAFSFFVKENFSAAFLLLTAPDQEGKERGTNTTKPPGDNSQ